MRSEQGKSIAGFLGLLLGLSLANVALGQAPPPPAPVPTIWDKLGVTGFHNCLESKLVNPHGNHPGSGKEALAEEDRRPGQSAVRQSGHQGRRASQAAGGPRSAEDQGH